MATYLPTAISQSGKNWTFTWSAGGNVDLYLCGEMIEENYSSSSITIANYQGTGCPALFIVDNSDFFCYPGSPRVRVQWRSVSGAEAYQVYRVTGAVYDLVEVIPVTDERSYFQWSSPISTDTTDWHVAVYAVKGKSTSTVALLQMPVVDWPVPPKFTVTIESSTEATLALDITPDYVG